MQGQQTSVAPRSTEHYPTDEAQTSQSSYSESDLENQSDQVPSVDTNNKLNKNSFFYILYNNFFKNKICTSYAFNN